MVATDSKTDLSGPPRDFSEMPEREGSDEMQENVFLEV